MARVQQQHTTGWTGWIWFAGFLMGLEGILHIIFGIGGIFSQDWYLYSSGTVMWIDASAWGWSLLIGGILLLLSSALLVAGNMLGRVMGIILALGSIVANLALISVTPIWSIIAIVLDIIIIYAIAAHGSEMKHYE